MISGRVGLTFSRMIAFAMGGATDLSPIKNEVQKRANGQPNWPLIERAYATTGALNALLALLVALLALGMGWYGLEVMLTDYRDARGVWAAFTVVIFSQSVVFWFQRYQIALKGMNYVALSNRWDVVFSLLSVIGGVVVLHLGGSIFQLAQTMQGIVLLSVVQNRFLLRSLEEGNFKHFKAWKLDRQMLTWAWEPAWRGFVVSFANSGTFQIAAVFCARYLSVGEAASILLTMRLANTLQGMSNAPLMSHTPRIARLFSEGNIDNLSIFISRKLFICQTAFAASLVSLAILGPLALEWMDANAELISAELMSAFALFLLVNNFLRLALIIPAAANHIVCVERQIISLAIALPVLYVLMPVLGIWGLIIGIFIPNFIILNSVPVVLASSKIKQVPLKLAFRSNTLGLSVLLINSIVVTILG